MLKIVLTKNQWERISEVLGNLGLLTIASLILPFVFENLNVAKIIWGIVLTAVFWYISIIIAKKY